MSSHALLNAAARTYVMVCLSDGRMVPVEDLRFTSTLAAIPAFRSMAPQDVKAAYARAKEAVTDAESFAAPIASIAAEASGAADKTAIMRVAQAALIADGRVELQENACVAMLAEALGLDPAAF
jgi:tellurite resistance protein